MIGATKMDEKLLEEIRRQEEAFLDEEVADDDIREASEDEPIPVQEEVVSKEEISPEAQDAADADSGETKQTTLFGGDY